MTDTEGKNNMMGIEDLRNKHHLLDDIDWDMTPEEAVTLYLEWGNNWSHGRMVRSKEDVSYYFVINTWDDPPTVTLLRRNSEEAVEVAEFELPEHLRDGYLKTVARRKGVYPVSKEVRAWLETELSGQKRI
jgi:hypothetical protein